MYTHRDFPEKSWSASKLESFYRCKRQYYFNSFGQWNGWEFNSSDRTKLIYRLKKIQNAYTLSGQLLHDQISTVFNYKQLNVKSMIVAIRTKLNDAVKDSINKKDYWISKPNRANMLHEYYYGNGISKELGNKITTRMKQCLENFSKSDIYKLFSDGAIAVLENEEDNFPYFVYNSYKVFCILDLLYKYQDKYYIVDWKTGKPADDENSRQMMIYVLYVLSKYKDVSLTDIRGANIYLQSGEVKEYSFDSEDIIAARDLLENSIKEMNSYLTNIEENQPKDEDYFNPTTSRFCFTCNFIEVCKQGSNYINNSINKK